SEEQVARGDFNPKMFNSFLDGTKSALEMAAVANATGLAVPRDGLTFPACRAGDLATVLRPRNEGVSSTARVWSRSYRRWSATAHQCHTIYAGASLQYSRRLPNTYAAASPNTAS